MANPAFPELPEPEHEYADPARIFIGREQQLDLFEMYLTRWKRLIASTTTEVDSSITTAPSPNHKLRGLIVLLYGRGGFGKSTLLHRYHEMAREETHHLTVSGIIDWEFAIEGKRGLFNPPQGQEVDARDYYRLLCTQLSLILGKAPKDFRIYQAAVKAVESARKQANKVLDRMQNDDRYASLRGQSIETLSELLGVVAPAPFDKLVTSEQAKGLADQGIQMGAEMLTQVRAKFRDELGTALGDYLDAPARLGFALGHDLREWAKNFPLLLFFDTYEEVDTADSLLRLVMYAAGQRVGWVLAGRDNLWGGSEQRKRSIAKEYGYKELVPADRCLSVDFNVGGVGAFTTVDIQDYLGQICRQARLEPPLPLPTEEQVEHILNVTMGIPLAVAIAAALYLETGGLEQVTEIMETQRKIVEQMIERYLLHARDEQSERLKLYGLALLRRADQPLAVTTALGLGDEEARTGYEGELSRLHRRYSFVFTDKVQPSLHEEVRHFLRLWLLERRQNPEMVALHTQLKNVYEMALKELEESRQYQTFQERLQDDEWVGVYLDLAEQQFWLDPVAGIHALLPFLVAAAVYRRDLTKDAAEVGSFFATAIPAPYHQWWNWATQSLLSSTNRHSSEQELAGLQKLAELGGQRGLSFPAFLPESRKELEAALWWRLGEACEDRDKTRAFAWYEKALTRLHGLTDLYEAAAEAAWDIAYHLYGVKKYAECLPLLERAIELKPDYMAAYNSRGVAYGNLKEYEKAIEDYNRAIELEANYASVYCNRGLTYRNLKEYEKAIADFNRAIELDLTDTSAYIGRGNTYRDLREYERAIEDYDRAITLDLRDAKVYYNRGLAYDDLHAYEWAIEDYNRAIELEPKHALAYHNRGIAYWNLKEYERAIKDYNRVIELEPTYARAYRNRGIAYRSLKEDKLAVEDYNRAIELDPQDALTYLSRGVAYGDLKEYEQAIADFNRAIELDPRNALAYDSRGHTYRNLKTHRLAIEDYNRAIALDLRDAKVYYNRGLAYDDLHEYERAVEDYNRAIELEPEYVSAYHNRGVAYWNLKKYEMAIEDYNRVIVLDPGDTSAYNNRGSAYDELKEYRRAIEDFSRAIELAPEHASAYRNRGLAYGNLKEYERAIEDYNRAIELESRYVSAYYNRGLAYGNLNQYERAMKDYNRAIELESTHAPAYANRGLACLYQGDRQQAMADFRSCCTYDPTDTNAAWMAEWANMDKKRVTGELAERLERITRSEPDEYIASVCRGVILGLRGRLKEGLLEIERAIPLDPEEWDAYFWKGMLAAYYYRRLQYIFVIADSINQALVAGLPPVLLTPLYWLETDLPDLFAQYARPLLQKYGV
jgi:tetratricopeptide (TPR) repeat protein